VSSSILYGRPYPVPGKHTYLQIFTVHLDDFTDKGTLWKTWENLSNLLVTYWSAFSSNLVNFFVYFQQFMRPGTWALSQGALSPYQKIPEHRILFKKRGILQGKTNTLTIRILKKSAVITIIFV
jgi:hypothetical protein